MDRSKNIYGVPGTAAQQPGADVREARVLGGGDFVEQLLKQAEEIPALAKRSLDEIIVQVCAKTGLALTDLT